MNLTIISLILSSLLTANLQGPSKLVKVVHWKDEPVEFVSVKLRGRTLNPGNSLDAYPDWNKELEITVKNVSEKPITFVSVELSTSNDSDTEAVATTLYTFGSMPGGDGAVRYLKPSETTLLTHQWTTGDPLDPRPVEISFRVVFWNNDKSVQWRAGRLLQLVDPDTGRYVPKPKSGARYQYPKGFHASPQFVSGYANKTVVQISYFGRFQQSTPGCGVVTGRVVDQTNRPVAGVKVYSMIMDRPPRGRVLYTISDSKGEFTLSCAEVGRNAIYATNEDEGYPDTLMTPFIDAKSFPVVEVKPEATGSVEVVLPPKSGRLVARVVDAKSKKVIDGATVTLCRAEAPSDCRSLRATQRVDGISSLIPPIPFTIKASAKAYTDQVLLDDKGRPAVIRISPETTRIVEIKLKPNVH